MYWFALCDLTINSATNIKQRAALLNESAKLFFVINRIIRSEQNQAFKDELIKTYADEVLQVHRCEIDLNQDNDIVLTEDIKLDVIKSRRCILQLKTRAPLSGKLTAMAGQKPEAFSIPC